jgi:hypothetical protein
MDRHTKRIMGRIVVIRQGPSGIVAKVNGTARLFRDRESLFRAAVVLAEGQPDHGRDGETLR